MPAGSRLVILMYHRVLSAPDPLRPADITLPVFDECMSYLKRFFNVLPLSSAAARLQERSLPRRAVAITFDDGYADNFLCAAPVLQRYELPASVFVANGFLDGGQMWNDTVIESVRGVSSERLDLGHLGSFDTGSWDEKRRTVYQLLGALKKLSIEERLAEVSHIADTCRLQAAGPLMMTSAQVAGLAEAGIEVGAHTVNHPILAKQSAAEAAREIAESKSSLESICGRAVTTFAYPNGRPGTDYRACDVAAVRDAGFESAVTTSWGSARHDNDPLQLPRIGPWDQSGWRLSLRILRSWFEAGEELPRS